MSASDAEGAPSGERLQKVMASAGVASRRESERLIARGRVSVNGEVILVPGRRVDAALDRIEVDGNLIQSGAPRRYGVVHKPPGVLTTVNDPFGRAVVMDLVEEPRGLFPVGRLDKDSEGLVLVTDDGGLANRLTHPRYHVPKTYVVIVEARPAAASVRRLRTGIQLSDGRTAPAEVSEPRGVQGGWSLRITLREGRKRQIRRMLEAVGHPVCRLVRIGFGPLELGDLPPGQARSLTEGEIEALRRAGGPVA